jgi:hypothetical protein
MKNIFLLLDIVGVDGVVIRVQFHHIINEQQAAFAHEDPKSAKKTDNLAVFLRFWDCTRKSCSQNVDEINPRS